MAFIRSPFFHFKKDKLNPSCYLLSLNFARILKMTDYIRIGKFVSTFGLNGSLLLIHDLGKKTSLRGLKTIYTEEGKQNFIPWFIENTKIKSEEEIFIKLEEITNREQAMKITQKEVWIPSVDFKKYAATSSPINLLGYTILEGDNMLGKIIEIIEQPHQILCTIRHKGKEVFIPLHEETIKKIDKKNLTVIVVLPPGLLEIYL